MDLIVAGMRLTNKQAYRGSHLTSSDKHPLSGAEHIQSTRITQYIIVDRVFVFRSARDLCPASCRNDELPLPAEFESGIPTTHATKMPFSGNIFPIPIHKTCKRIGQTPLMSRLPPLPLDARKHFRDQFLHLPSRAHHCLRIWPF